MSRVIMIITTSGRWLDTSTLGVAFQNGFFASNRKSLTDKMKQPRIYFSLVAKITLQKVFLMKFSQLWLVHSNTIKLL